MVDDILQNHSDVQKRLISDFDELHDVVSELRKKGKRIVLTQGVWDLIHEGHALYLDQAKKQGDVLIVGVDSDRLTRERKGPNRPIVPESERLQMLAHLRSVDVLFLRDNNEDREDLVRAVHPDVFVISSSTTDIPQSEEHFKDYCEKLVCFEPQATTSTTARIRRLTIEGAEQLARQINELTEEFLQKIKKS